MLKIPNELEIDPAFAPVLRLADGLYLTPGELAKHWRISVGHLGLLRRQGKGPRYVLINRHVRYRHSDVLAYEFRKSLGPVTPDALALAVATLPAVTPEMRDFLTKFLIDNLFPEGVANGR